MTPAILLLMHQGRSFVEEIAEIAHARGMALVAVSSRPERDEVFQKNRGFLDGCIVTDSQHLQMGEVENAASRFSLEGYDLRAVLATFEAYRLFMAKMNQMLGARDCAPDSLRICLDKFELRRTLRSLGLSEVRSHRTDDGTELDLDPAVRWFVKPVRGAGSFACFLIESRDDLRDLTALRQQMQNDHQMSAIFMGQFDFTIEEYVEGPEFSFEIVAAERPITLCVHEKAKVDRLRRTTLESMSVSPAISLSAKEITAGADFVAQCLSALNLNAGAFHVEAKYWISRRRWEIIEINPRMGGSLIGASISAITGVSMLALWIDSLLYRDQALPELRQQIEQASQLRSASASGPSEATVFLSMYGEKGRTIRSISFDPGSRPPDVLKIHFQSGDMLDDSDRAIALMDALWQVRQADLRDEVDLLANLAKDQFHVTYL
ncbi:MAG: ATP-grasp domain-containing protein [Burkholderiaceae bacterium]